MPFSGALRTTDARTLTAVLTTGCVLLSIGLGCAMVGVAVGVGAATDAGDGDGEGGVNWRGKLLPSDAGAGIAVVLSGN